MNNALSDILKKKILALKSQLGMPYSTAVTKPVDETLHCRLTNFLRNGPHRKVFSLYCAGGDYQYDENMSTKVESAMEAECKAAYKKALIIAEELFGKSRSGRPKKGKSFYEPDTDDFADKEDREYDGFPWSVEYEGGAVYQESGALRHWEVDADYIFLQQGRWTGDDDFVLFALMTVTPKLDTSAATGDVEPDHSASASGKPKEIVALEQAIGDTLQEAQRDEVMDWFKRNTYSVDGNDQITGLNLRNNDLTSLETLKGFHHLEKLSVADNAIADLSDIAQLHHLCELSLAANLLQNLDGIEGLTKLTALNVNGNEIRSLEKLQPLTGLRELYAHGNAIDDLEPLRNLTALVELGVQDNEIGDMGALKGLANLKILKAGKNQIGDLGVLAHLKELRHLEIDGNPVVKKMALKLNEHENQIEAVRAVLKQG